MAKSFGQSTFKRTVMAPAKAVKSKVSNVFIGITVNNPQHSDSEKINLSRRISDSTISTTQPAVCVFAYVYLYVCMYICMRAYM